MQAVQNGGVSGNLATQASQTVQQVKTQAVKVVQAGADEFQRLGDHVVDAAANQLKKSPKLQQWLQSARQQLSKAYQYLAKHLEPIIAYCRPLLAKASKVIGPLLSRLPKLR